MTPLSTYKLIRSLSPYDVFDILTKGICPDLVTSSKDKIDYLYSQKIWQISPKVDTLDLYLSDTGFQTFTNRSRAEELEKEFKSWNIFFEVWSRWYGGSLYRVGFNYDYKAFDKLYNDWCRDKKLVSLLDEQ